MDIGAPFLVSWKLFPRIFFGDNYVKTLIPLSGQAKEGEK
jgi:hypothetical protein